MSHYYRILIKSKHVFVRTYLCPYCSSKITKSEPKENALYLPFHLGFDP